MKVRFIKDHPGGIKEGEELTVRKPVADKWMIEGYIEIIAEVSVEVEKPKASSLIGGNASKKKQSKQSKSGKGKK